MPNTQKQNKEGGSMKKYQIKDEKQWGWKYNEVADTLEFGNWSNYLDGVYRSLGNGLNIRINSRNEIDGFMIENFKYQYTQKQNKEYYDKETLQEQKEIGEYAMNVSLPAIEKGLEQNKPYQNCKVDPATGVVHEENKEVEWEKEAREVIQEAHGCTGYDLEGDLDEDEIIDFISKQIKLAEKRGERKVYENFVVCDMKTWKKLTNKTNAKEE